MVHASGSSGENEKKSHHGVREKFVQVAFFCMYIVGVLISQGL
jgi:hypothetical protein